MTNIDVRKMKREELPQVKSLWQYAFQDPEDFVDWYFADYVSFDEVWVAVQEERVLAALQSIQHTLHLPDRKLPTRYVVGVSTFPEARGLGLVQQLLKRLHQEIQKEKNPFWMLMPFEANFYAPYGFEWVHHHAYIEGAVDAMFKPASKHFGTWQQNPSWQEADKVYQSFLQMMQVEGVERTERFWKAHYHDIALSNGYIYGHQDADGRYDAMLFYWFEEKRMHVHECLYTTPLGRDACYSFLRSHRSQTPEIRWSAPIFEKAATSFSRRLHVKQHPFMMARVEDWRPFAQPIEHTFTYTVLSDHLMPEQTFRYEKGEIFATKDVADFTIPAQTLARLALSSEPRAHILFDGAWSVRNKAAWEHFVHSFLPRSLYLNEYF